MDKPRSFRFKYALFSAIPDELFEAIKDEHREIEVGEGAGQVGSKADCTHLRQTDHASVIPPD